MKAGLCAGFCRYLQYEQQTKTSNIMTSKDILNLIESHDKLKPYKWKVRKNNKGVPIVYGWKPEKYDGSFRGWFTKLWVYPTDTDQEILADLIITVSALSPTPMSNT